MARRWLLIVVMAGVLVVGAVFAAHAIRDDDTATPERDATTTTRAPSTTPATTTTAPVAASTTTAAPTTTTAAPSDNEPPGPCGAETGAIRAAIDAGVANAQANADLASCRVAASDSSWAAVQLAAKPGASFDVLTVIVHGGAGSWAIVATGGTNAGCGAAPQQVIVDLGQFCAGTGGGAT
jgi:cytoskeletal protein RodZ